LLVAFCFIVVLGVSMVVEEPNLKPSSGSKIVVELSLEAVPHFRAVGASSKLRD
jgi:hypothetical protein